jgi:amino acid permease
MTETKPIESEKAYAVDSSIVTSGSDVEYSGGEIKQTHRGLKPRHVTMIGISGAIGTGLFVSLQAASRSLACAFADAT